VVVAVSPSSLVLTQSERRGLDYIQTLVDVVLEFVRDEDPAGFLIVPNATREGHGGPRNNDLIALERLRARLEDLLTEEEKERIAWADFDLNTASIRSLLSFCDGMVTSRFHAMIAGLCLTIPTVVLGWSHKYEEVLSQFGMNRYAFSFDEEGVDLNDRVRELLRDRNAIQASIRRERPAVVALARNQFSRLKEVLR
jgi:polysaccharide pyruvyl transferase WcaK-like protein